MCKLIRWKSDVMVAAQAGIGVKLTFFDSFFGSTGIISLESRIFPVHYVTGFFSKSSRVRQLLAYMGVSKLKSVSIFCGTLKSPQKVSSSHLI